MGKGRKTSARVLEARGLHAEGWGYKRIAKHFGVTRDRARDWCNPERRRRLTKAKRGVCMRCGGPKHRDKGRERPCRACQVEIKEERWRAIQRRWLAGENSREISAALGLTLNHLGMDMVNMRKANWNLPYAPGYPRG